MLEFYILSKSKEFEFFFLKTLVEALTHDSVSLDVALCLPLCCSMFSLILVSMFKIKSNRKHIKFL